MPRSLRTALVRHLNRACSYGDITAALNTSRTAEELVTGARSLGPPNVVEHVLIDSRDCSAPRSSQFAPTPISSVAAILEATRVRDGPRNVFGRAAELAYFFLFSIFPLLLVMTTAMRVFGWGDRILTDMLNYFGRLMPPAAYDLVTATLGEVCGR